jgi:uncharacterized Zn finger protein (UPF0148 family)
MDSEQFAPFAGQPLPPRQDATAPPNAKPRPRKNAGSVLKRGVTAVPTTCPDCGGPKFGRGFRHGPPCKPASSEQRRAAPKPKPKRQPPGDDAIAQARALLVAERDKLNQIIAALDDLKGSR